MRKDTIISIIGNRYGRLVVISKSPKSARKIFWLCQCDCGQVATVRGDHLKELRVRSCGCLDMERMTTHGKSRTPEYHAWQAIKDRCGLPHHRNYKNYGGRGITICERWINSFENFFADMGERPTPTHSIDRWPDNDGHYEPANCRWATRKEQVDNRRNSLLCTINGKKQCVKDWCKELKIVSYEAALLRIRKGWPIERAVTAPPHSMSCITDENANMHS